MGGKQNLANRTKNNARPSSSGRSAAMLNSSLPQFGGFSGVKESSGLSPFSFGPTEEFDSAVDESFQLVIKKISKKDSTTKLKGLQEFADLVKSSESNAVKTVLPIWPRFYSVLATDSDNKVREATHNVHHQLVIKVRRSIAPYLKQIIAPWFTSQYDTYPPAATAATQSFKETFSEGKFQEAIIFCQEEILYYIYENLGIQMDQTAATQDADGKFERILISCLQGYSLYLQTVSEEKIKEAAQSNLKIILNSKYWKLAKSNVSLVRSAWFQVLSVMLQKANFLLKDKESQVLSTALGSLNDEDPIVLPHVWECVLLATSVISDWWKCVNIDKLFIPKLLEVLKHGGQGNAIIIYPNLLPLLSKLPPMEEQKSVSFYNSFFENMRLGLRSKSVATSKSESTAIATAFIECLQFLIIKKPNNNLCKPLIKNQLVSTVQWCLTDNSSCYKTIFNQTSMFIQCLSRYGNPEIKSLIDFFFNEIQKMFSVLLQPSSTKVSNILLVSERQIDFLRSLKQIIRSKKTSHVKFASQESEQSLTHKTYKENLTPSKSYFVQIDQLAVNIFQDYINYTSRNSSQDLLDRICSLIIEFDTKIFFDNLLEKIKRDTDDTNVKYLNIYNLFLKKWLVTENIYCKNVINIIFLLLTYLPDKEKEIILDDLIEINIADCLMWSVSTALSYPYVENPVVQKWLKNEKIGSFFVSIADKQIANECTPELAVIFKLALTENISGDLYITEEVLSEIIEKISSTLLNSNKEDINLDSCVSLAAHLCSIIYTETLLLTYGDKLLRTLFEISCKFENEQDNLSMETIWEIKSAWQDALTLLISYLDKTDSQSLIEKIADIIECQFLTASVTSKEQVEHLASIIVLCINVIYRSTSIITPLLVELILQKPCLTQNKTVVEVCKVAEYIKGDLCSPYHEVLVNENINETDILHYFASSFIRFNVFCSELNDNEETDEDDDEQCMDDEICKDVKHELLLNVLPNTEDNLLEALYSYVVGESFLNNFNNVKYFNEIVFYNTCLEGKLQETFLKLDQATIKKAKLKLKENCLGYGWFWCRAAFSLHNKFLKSDDTSSIYSELRDNLAENKSVGVLHIKQIFTSEASEDSANIFSENINYKMISLIEQMENLRKESRSDFLFENVNNISWEKAERVINVVRRCSNFIQNSSFTQAEWDFIVISLVSWVSNCLQARALVNKFQYQSMLISVSKLYIHICTRVEKFKEDNVNTSFVNEWEDILLENVHADLAQLWMYLLDQLSTKSENVLCNFPFMQYFGPVIEHLKCELIFKTNDSTPKWTKFFKKSCNLLTNSQTNLQLWGYRMLKVLIPGLIKIDTEAVNTRTPHKKGLIFEQFKEKLIEVQNVVDSMLMDFRIGADTCRVEPSYDSFVYTFAYLLLWDVMLCLCEKASAELRYQYADWLKNGDLLPYFLSSLFKLMPAEICQCNEGKSKSLDHIFLQNPLNNACYGKCCDSETIEQMVCYLYKTSLVQLPALVRQWWTDLDLKSSQLVDKITTLYVSPHLCMDELNDVMKYQNAFKNMKVKVMLGVREILAIYTVDETQMELSITLPVNYPLGSPDIHCDKQISGANQKQWLLQFKKCVLHQNGSIWDGLSLWNNNLDKKFNGVEECYICYAVLHFGTCQLPRLSCQTCKKKFHSACLYKWFSTSNKSSCPICRNLF